jgi:hypothetical protein
MKKIYIPVILLLLIVQGIKAQKNELPPATYAAAGIPEALKADANFVVRYENLDMEIKAQGKAIFRSHRVVTILNDKAQHKAALFLNYDNKFAVVKNPEVRVFDASGKLIKQYKKSDWYDRSASDQMTMVTDDRVMQLRHAIASYPITLEFKFEYMLDNYLSLPSWYLQEEDNTVQQAYCRIKVNPSLGFRYYANHVDLKPTQTQEDGFEIYTWAIKDLKAMKPEPGSEAWTYLPRIDFATDKIIMGGINGDLSTWNGFGKWQQELSKGVDDLPPARVAELKQMVATLPTAKEKAKFLYEYMQKNMRYVGIQLGIGGLKPFPASFVDAKKYGDCKALSNYMYTLLKAVDIPAHYAIINAGENAEPVNPAFVRNAFNHIVLCIPFQNDTTWLECTSNTQAFGKLGIFTENRYALIITPEGGKLVNTPRSNKSDHVFDSKVWVDIDEHGVSKVKMDLMLTGEYRSSYIRNAYSNLDDQKKSFINNLNLRQPDVFQIKPLEDRDGIKTMELQMEYEKLNDQAAGNKLFYRPRIFDLWKSTLPVAEKRNTNFYFASPFIKKSHTTYQLPENMELEVLPANADLKFSYGSYQVKYTYDKDKNEIQAEGMFELNNHIIPPAHYQEMQVFMDEIAKSMTKKMVLKKKS